jgi:CDP-diacylglycerol---glycerol-3-phosphate 3-phosphatidyltransferase
MRSRWGRLLVAGRFARGLYGALKLATFGWLFLVQPWPVLYPELWNAWKTAIAAASDVLVFATVVMCVARAVPVVIEYLWAEGVVARPKVMREAR